MARHDDELERHKECVGTPTPFSPPFTFFVCSRGRFSLILVCAGSVHGHRGTTGVAGRPSGPVSEGPPVLTGCPTQVAYTSRVVGRGPGGVLPLPDAVGPQFDGHPHLYL